MDDNYDEGKWDEKEEAGTNVHNKKNNVLPLWGNERTMNLNPLILTNIQSSHYFKVNLYELKTYHEVIDEIYYKVSHLEPWEKGSRKTAGQTGMCGGVRGVGAGGIVSTAFCLLYKLFTLKLTRKQVIGLITHPDSPYIRVLGFMYIRYTQPPADLWDWYEPYLDDTEELDVKAGGGQIMAIGNILKNFLCKLEWFSTLFPRIPVPIQQKLEKKMSEKYPPSTTTSRRAVSPGRSSSRSRYSHERDQSRYSRSRDYCGSNERYTSPSRHSRYRSLSHDRNQRSKNSHESYRERSPHASNGHCSVSQDDDRYRERDEYVDRKEKKNEHRYSRDHEDRYSRVHHDRKYKDKKSPSPERHRSRKSKEEKSTKYYDDNYEHRKSDRRKRNEDNDEDEARIRKSKYD